MLEVNEIIIEATLDNYNEEGYLKLNSDVRKAVLDKKIESGKKHFEAFGINEKRTQFDLEKLNQIANLRKSKLSRIDFLNDMEFTNLEEGKISYLTNDLKTQFHIVSTNNVSSNNYDPAILEIINKYKEGIILDCGAGLRSTYYSNVVNFEIANYWSTDVLGVGEKLPFEDNTFDAVISVAVLEHVKDPFTCANEISRVLKKGGTLFSAIPFLQPYHGYPHHYYNMTHQGHSNLYEKKISIDKLEVFDSLKPIFTLTWFLNSYCNGLPLMSKMKFKNMKIKDLLDSPISYLNKDFVKNLSNEANMDLASGTVLIGTKK